MDSSNETTATGPSTALAMGLLGSGTFFLAKTRARETKKQEHSFLTCKIREKQQD